MHAEDKLSIGDLSLVIYVNMLITRIYLSVHSLHVSLFVGLSVCRRCVGSSFQHMVVSSLGNVL